MALEHLKKGFEKSVIDPAKRIARGEGELEDYGRVAAGVATGGLYTQGEIAVNTLDDALNEKAKKSSAKIAKPGEQESTFSRTTDEERKEILDSYDRQGQATQQAIRDAQGQMQTRAEQTSALGPALVNQSGQVFDEARRNLPTRQATTVENIGPLERAQFNRGAISGPADASGIRAAGQRPEDLYQAGQGQQYLSQLGQQLYLQSQGQGPSLAEQQFKQANEANLAASLAQQASIRGGFDPAAARQIRQSAANLQAQAARDAAAARIQEQMNAQQQLAGVGSAMEQNLQQQGQQSLQAGQLGVQAETAAAGVEQTNRAQDIDVEKFATQLEDTQIARDAEIRLKENFKNADFAEAATSEAFQADVSAVMQKAVAKSEALQAAYQGDMRAMEQDIQDFNAMIIQAMQSGISIEAAKEEFKRALVAEGKDERVAEAITRNLNAALQSKYQQAINDREAAMYRDKVATVEKIVDKTTQGVAQAHGMGLFNKSPSAPPSIVYEEAGTGTMTDPMVLRSSQNEAGFNPYPSNQYLPGSDGYEYTYGQGPIRR